MSIYIQSVFIAIPLFVILILVEAKLAIVKGLNINNPTDMISSLSSGLTDTIKAGIKFSFALISYTWLVENLTIYKVEPIWLAILIAFIVEDFAGYWMHRLNHRVNIFFLQRIYCRTR